MTPYPYEEDRSAEDNKIGRELREEQEQASTGEKSNWGLNGST
jgi:hypothetical protein